MTININKARQNLIKRQNIRQEKLNILFEKANDDFNKIITMIKVRYKPQKIVQWGSLLDKTLFTEVSDIDIAIQGIDTAEQYFALLKDAEKLTDFPIDLIQLEKTNPLHRESILKNGKIIYERSR